MKTADALDPFVDDSDAQWVGRVVWLRRWLVVCWLALIASTWRLWTPQTVFPQIPFFGWLRDVPGWVDWVALAALVFGAVGMVVASSRERVARATALLAVSSTVVLVLLNQHRFQPWAYQFVIVALALGFVPSGKGASLLRLLTVGIYFWSAVSKFDCTFLHGLGPELLRGTLGAFGLEPRFMRPEAATALAWAFPLDELAVAVLLAFRRTRVFGLVGAVAMHALLLATLGPWGLDHSLGVLLWNVYFIGQDVLLFGGKDERRAGRDQREGATGAVELPSPLPLSLGRGESDRRGRERSGLGGMTPAARLVSGVVVAAVTLPVLEPLGWLDQWLGWAVYAPGGKRAVFMFQPDDRRGLPEPLRPYFEPFFGSSVRSGPYFDRWSLDALDAPMYPQDRFRVGVALAVVERYGDGTLELVSVAGRADRFTGSRGGFVPLYQGGDGVRAYAESFWLNALPRKIGGW